ncbi:MAG: hypothetical protein LUD79_09565 [Oscillospiraceae bacterium]|nr:hypothetical protein [Oscillospiraceae bacterium]
MNSDRVLSPEDAALLREYYMREFSGMYKTALFCLGNPHLAEDAVQDTFVHMAQHMTELRDHPNPTGWLYQTLRHTILHVNRARSLLLSKTVPLEPEHMDLQRVEPEEVSSLDMEGNQDLALLNRYYIQGVSLRALAEEAQVSEAAMKMRLSGPENACKRIRR